MSSADTATEAPEAEPDELREGVLSAFAGELGDRLVASELQPGRDLYLRVARDDWESTARTAKSLGFRFFDHLSAIDWLPSPYGRYEDSAIDDGIPGASDEPMQHGVTGGDTRFQLISRVFDVEQRVGVNLRCDLPDDDLRVATLIDVYAGANWHERETHEMFGVRFDGHPYLAKLYLPTGFEGHPLRKDFPLVARIVKPWPGIVDVEPMPDEEDEGEEEAATDE